jgi:DNA repair protein RecN (Recombination protein N)
MSILRISLKNFVIVPQLELELPHQFSALTGETGAGKSILIDALQLALGQRADTSVVFEGASQAEIAVEFAPNAAALAWLHDAGFALDAGDSLLLRRTLDTAGKSRAWINGSAATLTQLRELGEYLVDIHGQHAWASLGKAGQAAHVLDAFGHIDSSALRSAWQVWRKAQAALQSAQEAQSTLADERERLAWQIAEVSKLQPAADEWEGLNQDHQAQAHMQDLQDASATALQALEGKDASDSDAATGAGAVSGLQAALQALAPVQHLQPSLTTIAEQLHSLLAQAQDAAHDLRSASRHFSPDAQQLAALDERLSLWLSLARRYKTRPEDLPALLQNWREKLANLNAAADLDALAAALAAAEKTYLQHAASISRARKLAAPKLQKAITQTMQQLGMTGGSLHIELAACAPQAGGQESVEFLIAGHAGVAPKPLGKVASGGELSRVALAFAVISSAQDGAPTLIFDEVDSGIGGAVAQTVGQLMRQLGQGKQVLAVTHLAQVAASAHQQLRVSKVQSAGKTSSSVELLAAPERVAEVARMLAGSTSATSLAHAQELLEQVA